MTRSRRRFLALAAALSSATVFQFIPNGCAPLMATLGTQIFDFCSVLNCSQGAFFDLCNPTIFLVDCPQVAAANP